MRYEWKNLVCKKLHARNISDKKTSISFRKLAPKSYSGNRKTKAGENKNNNQVLGRSVAKKSLNTK